MPRHIHVHFDDYGPGQKGEHGVSEHFAHEVRKTKPRY